MRQSTSFRTIPARGAAVAILLFALIALAGSAAPARAQAWEPQVPAGSVDAPTGDLLIRDLDRVWTAAGEVLEGVSILITDGIIREIGPDLPAPSGVPVVDGRGLTAIPGLVDEHSHTAMAATNEGSSPIVPEVRVLDALTAESFGIYRALSGGVTTARIMHGSANPIGGQSAVIKMRWGMDEAEDLLVDGAPRFVKFALGENVTRKNFRRPGQDPRFPASRPGVEAIYQEAFTAARAYRDEWDRYRQDPDAFRVPPRRDLRLEALVDIMEGRIRIHAHSYRADEILMLMRIAERFGFRIDVFTHVLEGYQVASEMADHGAGGSTFSDWWQYKLEAFDAIPYNAALMHEAGVLTALNSDIPWLQTFMIYEIPKPVKYGMVSREDALRMLTLFPAQMLYVDDKVGSLEEGKHGDVVLLNGDPFNSFTRVEKTIVDGIVYFDLSDETGTRDEPFHARAAGSPGGDTGPVEPAPMPGFARELVDAPLVALVGATVHPVSGPAIPDGTVLIREGLIEEVGPSSRVQVPPEAVEVDVSGRHVYPGMIDPVTTLGLREIGSVPSATDTGETGTYNPHVRAVSAVNAQDPALNVARANGITSVLVTQSSGIVTGTAGVIQLRGDTWERMAYEPEVALMVDFPARREAPGDREAGSVAADRAAAERHFHGGPAAGGAWGVDEMADAPPRTQEGDEEEEEPTLEGERMEGLVELFRRSRLYAAQPSVRERPTDPFEPQVWGGDRVLLESMLPAIRGEVPVFFEADTEWQMKTLFVFLDTFPEIRPVVVGGTEAHTVVDELARRDVPVILTGAYSPTRDRDESIATAFRTPAILHEAGVPFAFGTTSNADVRNLPYHGAHSVAFGLPEEAALRAVTLSTAEILGIGDLTGSIEPGKRADLIVTDGSPLQVLTRIHRMFIGGVEVDPRDNKHYRLYREFQGRR